MFIGLCGTYLHANNTVKRQVALKVSIINSFSVVRGIRLIINWTTDFDIAGPKADKSVSVDIFVSVWECVLHLLCLLQSAPGKLVCIYCGMTGSMDIIILYDKVLHPVIFHVLLSWAYLQGVHLCARCLSNKPKSNKSNQDYWWHCCTIRFLFCTPC